MLARKRNKWDVTLQREDGEVVHHTIENYWDPKADGMADLIGVTAAAEAYFDHGRKQFKFAPIASSLVETK